MSTGNHIYRIAKKIEAEMREKAFLRNLVFVVTGINLAGFTLVPFLILLTGDRIEYETVIDLSYGILLLILLIYLSKKAAVNQYKYFDSRIPSFLFSIYFTTILIVFVIKTISLFVVPFLTTVTPYDIEMMQLYVWPALSYILWIWQFYILYSLAKLEFSPRI